MTLLTLKAYLNSTLFSGDFWWTDRLHGTYAYWMSVPYDICYRYRFGLQIKCVCTPVVWYWQERRTTVQFILKALINQHCPSVSVVQSVILSPRALDHSLTLLNRTRHPNPHHLNPFLLKVSTWSHVFLGYLKKIFLNYIIFIIHFNSSSNILWFLCFIPKWLSTVVVTQTIQTRTLMG